MPHDFNICQNVAFWSAGIAWLAAQTIKLVSNLCRTRHWDFRYLFSTGGMPSAHSAMVSSLATAIALECGMSSPIFAVAAIFAAIVMFDAQTVRRAAGLQARLLNQIVQELFSGHRLSQQKLAELLGHTPLQVYLGTILGISIAIMFNYLAH